MATTFQESYFVAKNEKNHECKTFSCPCPIKHQTKEKIIFLLKPTTSLHVTFLCGNKWLLRAFRPWGLYIQLINANHISNILTVVVEITTLRYLTTIYSLTKLY